MLELLSDEKIWREFLEYKRSLCLLSKREDEELMQFVDEKRYENIAHGIADGTYSFSLPKRNEINKMGTTKKRIVYTYSNEENIVLKLLAFLLHRYDSSFSPNCYAFRQKIGPRRAISDIVFNPELSQLCCFKSDITNYFNSIDVMLLEEIMRNVIDDAPLLEFLLGLLKEERVIYRGEIIREQKGVMAGTPISPFLANLYLMEMDFFFLEKGVCYARYSDDVVIFDTEDRIPLHIEAYRSFLNKYRLETNPSKESFSKAGEEWTFLGFSCCNGKIDISRSAVKKLSGKIRRSAHSFRRWMLKNNVSAEATLRAFNKKFNRKFYSIQTGRELCWSRWFFPVINTPETLHFIDNYMQDCQRYIVTGKHNKANYEKAPYSMLKSNGYTPLVTEYYRYRNA